MILKRQRLNFFSHNMRIAGAVLLLGTILLFWQRDLFLITFLREPIQTTPNETFSTQPLSLILKSPVRGEIRYTTDGSVPTASSTLFTEPIQVGKPTTIQFALFRFGQQISPTQSKDILVGNEHTIPVVSLTTDPENLWDQTFGILVAGKDKNFLKEGKDWEREATLRYYQVDGSLLFTQPVGVRLHGSNLRSLPQKSLRLYIQDENGQEGTLQYPIFGPESPTQFSSLILRSGGDVQYTLLRDRLANDLVRENSLVETTRSRPVVVYLNGEYWGLYVLQERYDERYFAEKYRVDPEALALMEVPLTGHEDRGKAVPDSKRSTEDAQAYNQLVQRARSCKGCLTYDDLALQADPSNLIDYLLFELYFGNNDWPYNNSKIWRYKAESATTPEAAIMPQLDGRFRWLFFDLDSAMAPGRNSVEDMMKSANGDPFSQLDDDAFPFKNLFSNRRFQREFMARLDVLLQTSLNPDHVDAVIDQMAAEMQPEMARHTARWGNISSDRGLHVVRNEEEWQRHVELLKVFMRQRAISFPQNAQIKFEKLNEVL